MTMLREKLKYTRDDYLSNKCSHSEYYEQFVSESDIKTTKGLIPFSDDGTHTQLSVWDNLQPFSYPIGKLEEAGDLHARTPSNKVCILKEACRIGMQRGNK